MATTFKVLNLTLGFSQLDTDKSSASFQVDRAADLEGQQFGSDATPLFNRIQIWKPVDGGPNNVIPNGAYDYAVGAGGARDKFIINDNNPTTGGFRFDFDAYVLINATYTYVDGTTSDTVVANVAQGAGPSGSQLWIVPPIGPGPALDALNAKPIAFVTFGTVVSDNNNMLADRPDPDLIDVIDGTSGDDDKMEPGFKDTTSYLESPDRQVIDDSGNYIRGGAGNDTITAGAGNDVIYGGSGSDVIRGGAGNDVIYGGDGDDQLFGGAGNDQLSGGAGNDTLDGGSGTNTLTGGTGNDTFVYNAGSTTAITDFNDDPNNDIKDGDSTTNDRVDLTAYYDGLKAMRADYADDGLLNHSNTTRDNNIPVDYSTKTSFAGGSLTFSNIASTDDLSVLNFETTGVTCFAAGTMIRTPQGEVPVETLQIGDLVSTWNGTAKPIRWIGKTELSKAQLDANPKLKPVVIDRSVLGSDRDLTVSPQHAFVVNGDTGVLVRAVHMVKNGWKGVRIAQNERSVTYLHIMLEQHDIIIAEGVPSESMYPGPMMIGSLDDAQREELFAIFPELQHIGEKDDVAALYGPSVLPYAKRSTAAADMLQLQKAG